MSANFPFPQELWEQTPVEVQAYIRALEARVVALEATVQHVMERLQQDSHTSSCPPSSDPPQATAKRPRREPRGRRPGGQPGHEGQTRALVPIDAVDVVRPVKPDRCPRCQHPLRGEDPQPERHQVTEIPPVQPVVREYQLQRLICPACGEATRAALPAGVPMGGFGPRVQAIAALCTGAYHLSKRTTQRVLADLFGVAISLGTMANLEQATVQAVAAPVAEARASVEAPPVAYLDETGWREGRARAWRWTAVTAWVTVFVVRTSRSAKVAHELLGERFWGILVTDRGSAYTWYPTWWRQVCWAHLLRDIDVMIERGGRSAEVGEALRIQARQMFHGWHRVRDGTLTHASFRVYMAPVRREVEPWLEAGQTCGVAKTEGMCRKILTRREIDPSQPHDLFSVLGTVSGFRTGAAILNRNDFEACLSANEDLLKRHIASWIPGELSDEDRAALLAEMKDDCLREIDAAIRPSTAETEAGSDDDAEDAPEEGEERPRQNAASGKLLDRLLYRGILPRYAFPTDVATFHVFDLDRSTGFRAIMRFAPSQGLPVALTQYAPGKQVWISGKCYTSGAIYSVMRDERYEAWQAKRLYLECSECGFAKTLDVGTADLRDTRDCEACGAEETFGPARYWLRPPGFAHPIDVNEVTSPDDMPETSYATRAKLTMPTPADEGKWVPINDRIRVLKERQHLLVSNTGPRNDGYSYCTKCGRIEASSDPNPTLLMPHRKPYPDDKNPACEGNGTTQHVVLGTDFITDIALFSLRVATPLKLKPGYYPTDVALRTVSEALAKAASQMLEIEPGELMAEYRPALTPAGRNGLEAEIFLYDTLPGGAGFASQLVDRGTELFQRALRLVKTCPENCDTSCYRCLRSFKNKFEHSLLDRHVGAELLEYLLTSAQPDFDAQRLKNSTALLYSDLLRQGDGGLDFEAGIKVTVAGAGDVEVPILAVRKGGKRFAIALPGPLTTDHPADPSIRELREKTSDIQVIVINELLVRGNLPAATREVQQRLGA